MRATLITLLFFSLSTVASAADTDAPAALKMRGRVHDEGTSIRGRILFEGDAITIRHRGLFKVKTASYDYGDIRKLTSERGLFGGDLLLAMKGDQTVTLHVRGGAKAKKAETALRDRLRSK